MNGAENVSLKDYITALHTLLNNSNAGLNDIPMIIDAKHYKKIIDKQGKLSLDEEKKADLYYKAMLNYTPGGFISALNPFSQYYQNLLEREAYKENPSIISRLADYFGG